MVTRDGHTLVIAVLGLGEAGSLIARDLTATGTRVRGYDPAVPAAEPVLDTASEAEAAQEAQLVLSVNSAKAAVEAFKAGLPGLLAGGQPRPDVLWADLNTASPGTKRQLAVLAADAGVPFAEVATVDRITDGTRRHAVRRTAEMEAAAEMLTELGVPPLMAEASRALHERLTGENLGQRRERLGQRRQRIGLGVVRQVHDDQV